MVPGNRTRGIRQKLMHRKLHLNTRKSVFAVSVTELWNRLPRGAVEAPSLGTVSDNPVQWAFCWRQDPLSDPTDHTALKNPCSLILKTMLESFYPADCGITMFHNFIFMLFNKKTYKIKELWVLDFEYNTISSQMKDICASLISKNCSQLKIGLLV